MAKTRQKRRPVSVLWNGIDGAATWLVDAVDTEAILKRAELNLIEPNPHFPEQVRNAVSKYLAYAWSEKTAREEHRLEDWQDRIDQLRTAATQLSSVLSSLKHSQRLKLLKATSSAFPRNVSMNPFYHPLDFIEDVVKGAESFSSALSQMRENLKPAREQTRTGTARLSGYRKPFDIFVEEMVNVTKLIDLEPTASKDQKYAATSPFVRLIRAVLNEYKNDMAATDYEALERLRRQQYKEAINDYADEEIDAMITKERAQIDWAMEQLTLHGGSDAATSTAVSDALARIRPEASSG